jgi:hypothetical protein
MYAQRWGGVHFEVLTPEAFIQQYEAAHPAEMQEMRDAEARETQEAEELFAQALLGAGPSEPDEPWLDLVPGEHHTNPHLMHATYNHDKYLIFWPVAVRFFLANRPSTDTVWEVRGDSPRRWEEITEDYGYTYIFRKTGPHRHAVRRVSPDWAEYNDQTPDADGIVAQYFFNYAQMLWEEMDVDPDEEADLDLNEAPPRKYGNVPLILEVVYAFEEDEAPLLIDQVQAVQMFQEAEAELAAWDLREEQMFQAAALELAEWQAQAPAERLPPYAGDNDEIRCTSTTTTRAPAVWMSSSRGR